MLLPQLIWLGDNYFFQDDGRGHWRISYPSLGTNPKRFVDEVAVTLGEMQCKAGIFDIDGN